VAFALGEAIAAEFRAIAALLNESSAALAAAARPLPSPPPSTTPSSPLTGSQGSAPPPPSTVVSSAIPLGGGVQVVDAQNAFASQPVTANPCPLFTAQDYATLLQLEQRAQLGDQSAQQEVNSILGFANGHPVTAVAQPVELTDQFSFSAVSNSDAVPVSFFGRIESPTGVITPFNYTLVTDTLGTIKTTQAMTGPGWLLDAAASLAPGTTLVGNVSALGMIGRKVAGNFTPHTLLFSGQVTPFLPLSKSLASPTAPASNPQFVHLTSGGSGTTISITIPAVPSRRTRLTNVFGRFTNSAVAGVRSYRISLTTDGVIYPYSAATSPFMIASQKGVFRAAIEGQQISANDGTTTTNQGLYVALPATLYFTTSFQAQFTLENPSAGDSLSAFELVYEIT
jgi:hypothetical protein